MESSRVNTHGRAKSCRASRRSSFKGKRNRQVLATGVAAGISVAKFNHSGLPHLPPFSLLYFGL
jgi:hypothetical protein